MNSIQRHCSVPFTPVDVREDAEARRVGTGKGERETWFSRVCWLLILLLLHSIPVVPLYAHWG